MYFIAKIMNSSLLHASDFPTLPVQDKFRATTPRQNRHTQSSHSQPPLPIVHPYTDPHHTHVHPLPLLTQPNPASTNLELDW